MKTDVDTWIRGKASVLASFDEDRGHVASMQVSWMQQRTKQVRYAGVLMQIFVGCESYLVHLGDPDLCGHGDIIYDKLWVLLV